MNRYVTKIFTSLLNALTVFLIDLLTCTSCLPVYVPVYRISRPNLNSPETVANYQRNFNLAAKTTLVI